MLINIRTSEANKTVVQELTRKVFHGASENHISRVAFAFSISKGVHLDLTNKEHLLDSRGKEYKDDILFGNYRSYYIAIICQHYQIYKTDPSIAKYIKMHIDHGLMLMNKLFEDNKNYSGLDFLLENIEKGIEVLEENDVSNEAIIFDEQTRRNRITNKKYFADPIKIKVGKTFENDPIFFNLNDTSIHNNAHMAVAGNSGTGKTHFAKSIMQQVVEESKGEVNFIFLDFKGLKKEDEKELLIPIKAQYSDLHDFDNTYGANPYGSLTFSITKDTLFGLVANGGANNAGVIFSMNKDGTGYADMLDFNFTNGAYPYGSLTLSPNGKKLYGMTSYAGTSSFGDIFVINTDGTGFNTLYNFDGFDAAYPYGSLIFSLTGDSLFGMTSYGWYGYGNIFSIDTNGTNYTDLFDFNGADGGQPYGSLLLDHSGKYMFGMTSMGTTSYGDIFVINTDGTGFWDGLNFNGFNGAYPQGSLIHSVTGDSLFGMTFTGSTSSYGNLFTVGSSGFTDMLDFYGANGQYPYGDLTLAGGVLYGMTSQGGTVGRGNLFSIHTNGSHYSDMLDFNSTNGSLPFGSLVFSNNVLYGMASAGGANDYGLIFSDTILSIGKMEVRNVTCTSGPDGSARAFPTGGVTPYTYVWLPGGATTQTITHLSMGTYTVVVADNTGSTATSIAIISGIIVSAEIFHSISCYGASDGAVIADVTWGTPPFVYKWSDGTTNSIDGRLSAGIYTVTVSDKCATATASVTLTQPPLLTISLTPSYSVICYGDSITLNSTPSGGTPPYTYFWFPSGGLSCTNCQNPKASPTSSSDYTVMVADSNGCTARTSDTIIVYPAPPTPTIVATSTDSIEFKVLSPGDTLTYTWALDDLTGHYDGKGDTVYLPVWPHQAKLTFYAKDPAGCISQASIFIGHNFPLPLWQQPYPRWSKRGIYLEYANDVIDTTYSTSINQITPFVNFCLNNHITYVCMDGLEYDAGDSGSVFGINDKWIDSVNASHLMSFIDSLKTRGGVEEVGIVCYNNESNNNADSMAASINYFNEHNNIGYYNLGLPWQEKIDVLSLDEEFWNNWPNRIPDTAYAEQYAWTVNDFHTVHMRMLKAMDSVAHQCPAGYLRVEDFIATPLDPWADYCCSTDSITCCNNPDTDLYHLNYYTKMEVDSIALYTDRILVASYTGYPTVLWNEGDFIQLDSEIAANPSHTYYKKEIWPAFSDENSSYSTCQVCAYEAQDNYSGADLCDSGKLDTAEYIEQLYYDSLAVSFKKKVFTNNLEGAYAQDSMKADTDFQVLGDIWFDYTCMNQEGIKFDTLTSGPNKGYLRFYVTVGPDIQWLHISVPPPLTITATIHGGKPPYTYTWYNIANGKPLYNGASNTYIATWSDSTGTYNVSQLGVVVSDSIHTPGQDTTVTDYLNIYQICDQPLYDSPVKRHRPKPADSVFNVASSVKIFPNPNTGQFTVRIISTDETVKTIEIYNMMGEEVFKEPLLNPIGDNSISLNTQANGLYFYRVLNENGKLTGGGKLIIEK